MRTKGVPWSRYCLLQARKKVDQQWMKLEAAAPNSFQGRLFRSPQVLLGLVFIVAGKYTNTLRFAQGGKGSTRS